MAVALEKMTKILLFFTKDPDRPMAEQNLAIKTRARDRQWLMDEVLELCDEVNRWDREMNKPL